MTLSDRDPSTESAALTDRELIARIRAGDVAAFEQVFLTYTPRLCDFVYRYLRSRDEAQEIVQELFATLWRGRDGFRLTGTLSSYLYTAARNQALNRLRHDRVVRDSQSHILSAAVSNENMARPDQALETAERQAAMARAVAELPDRQRAVCVLRWMHGLSYAAIAQQLGIAERTVDAHLRRALLALREKLARG